MHDEEPHLIEPSAAMREEFIAYWEEWLADGRLDVTPLIYEARRDFDAMVQGWVDEAEGRNLQKGRVPQTNYWLVRSGRILGTIHLRPLLNEHLLHEGGHIGYGVRPSERGRGYATRMLAMVLEKARDMGLKRVLVTCEKDNVASARVIRKNEGVLEDERVSRESGAVKQRYWIDL